MLTMIKKKPLRVVVCGLALLALLLAAAAPVG